MHALRAQGLIHYGQHPPTPGSRPVVPNLPPAAQWLPGLRVPPAAVPSLPAAAVPSLPTAPGFPRLRPAGLPGIAGLQPTVPILPPTAPRFPGVLVPRPYVPSV
jgi:hypothetical protein